MKLSPKDKTLVLKTRAHWVRMAEDPEGCGERPGFEHCALCQHYQVHTAGGCGECVVVRAGGGWNCVKTPASNASSIRAIMCKTIRGSDQHRAAVLEFQEAARKVVRWIDEHLLAEPETGQPLRDAGDPVGLRSVRLGGDAPSLRDEAAVVRRVADEQQLPSEVTRAAERRE